MVNDTLEPPFSGQRTLSRSDAHRRLIHFRILLSPPSVAPSPTEFVARIDGLSEERQRFSRLRDDVLVNGMLTQIGHLGPSEASARKPHRPEPWPPPVVEQLPERLVKLVQEDQQPLEIADDGAIDAVANDTIRTALQRVQATLAVDRSAARSDGAVPVGVDSPVHFDFDDFVSTTFQEILSRESERNANLRNYVGTLQLRLEQARHDPRYAFLFRVQPFENALASFLRLLFGTEPGKHFADSPPPWRDAYGAQFSPPVSAHQVTILDLSQCASEVLENVTALIGRLVLEFMQRNPERGKFPVVLVLEEAHHYIPANARLERQQRAREVFEKIAKEGRKFGLSLVVASQRPSELSRTVLAQCNSFIVHRIQNPDDQEYFKSVISGINRELLDQLPALAQQQGSC